MSVSTIIIAGFPADAPMRERKNAARLLAGFESAHCNLKTGAVFAKFDSPENAQAAVEYLSNTPYDMDDEAAGGLKVELTKRDLEVRDAPQRKPVVGGFGKGGAPSMAPVHMPLGASAAYYGGPPVSRDAGIDTVVVTKLAQQGWTPGAVNDLFGTFQGFMVCQYNERVDGCFVKFSSPRMAMAAVQRGSAKGAQVQMAKRSLELPGEGSGKGVGRGGAYVGYDSWAADGPPAKRVRTDPGTGPVDTLVVTKLAAQGLTADSVTAAFSGMPGYVACQHNERIDGCFIKFSDAGAALRAKQNAANLGIPIEIAKRSLQVL